MTEPTRDALHAETLAWLVQGQKTINTLAQGAGTMYGAEQHARETRVIAYAAECVRFVGENKELFEAWARGERVER